MNWRELPKEEWWVEGCLLIDYVSGQYFIHANGNSVNESVKVNEEGCLRFFAYEADPETVCEYTGLTDKNGRKIFENDFVSCRKYIGGNWVEYCIERGYVEMKHGAFGLHRKQGYYRPFKDWLEDYEYEVIGNIFDNSELLEGGDVE